MAIQLDGLPLGDDELAELFAQPHPPPPLQAGHYVKWFDVTLRCASKGCSSPTYCKLEGVPYCWKHIVDHVDKLLIQKLGPSELGRLRGGGPTETNSA